MIGALQIRKAARATSLSVDAIRSSGHLKIEIRDSPTIRLNGVDIEPAADAVESSRVCCRICTDRGVRDAAASMDLIRRAVRQPPAIRFEERQGGCK